MAGTLNKGTLDKGSLVKTFGGSSPTPPTPTPQGEYFVKVIDYDGTVIDEQWLDDGAEYTLPSAPSHDGLVFQEWSCSQDITNGKVTIDKHNIIIGAIYTTISGQNEFDIELTTPTGLTVTLNIDGDKDWGDGSAIDNLTTHTYSQAGKYTIKTDGTTITSSSSSGIFGQSNSTYNYYCTSIKLATITTIPSYSFLNCKSLKSVSISNTATTIGDYAFRYCSMLNKIIFSDKLLTIGQYAFNQCSYLENVCFSNKISSIATYSFNACANLKFVIIPSSVSEVINNSFSSCNSLYLVDLLEGITSLGSSCFSSCVVLTKIIIPSSLVSFAQSCLQYCSNLKTIKTTGTKMTLNSNTFGLCSSILEYDFTSITVVAGLYSTNAFSGINQLCKIKVSASLENTWKTTTGWSNYADYIVGV